MKRCKHCKVRIVLSGLPFADKYIHQPAGAKERDQYAFCKLTVAEPEEDKNGGKAISSPRESRSRAT
jgi:hypothetical protein